MLHGEDVNSFGVGGEFVNDAVGVFDNQLPAVPRRAKTSAGGLVMSSELLNNLKQQIASLPLPDTQDRVSDYGLRISVTMLLPIDYTATGKKGAERNVNCDDNSY